MTLLLRVLLVILTALLMVACGSSPSRPTIGGESTAFPSNIETSDSLVDTPEPETASTPIRLPRTRPNPTAEPTIAPPPSVSQDLRHRQAGVVVHDTPRYTAQEREGGYVAVSEGLRSLRRGGLDEASVAVGEVQHEVVDLPLHSSDDRLRLAEVALGMARWMHQRYVHLSHSAPTLPHVVLHYGVAAPEPILSPQPFVYPLRRVSLLLRRSPVLFQYPVNHPCVRLQLRPAHSLASPVSRRH